MNTTHAEIVSEMLREMEEVRLRYEKRLKAIGVQCCHTDLSDWLLSDKGPVQRCKQCGRLFNKLGEVVE